MKLDYKKQKKTNPKLLLRQSAIFSIVVFLVVLGVGGAVFLLSMRDIIRDHKHGELVVLLENKQIKLDLAVRSEIKLAVNMASSPLIKQYFEYPNPERREIVFREINYYREAFVTQNVFWINNDDKRYYFNGEYIHTLDINNPASAWYVRTLGLAEQTYDISMEYDLYKPRG